MVSAKYGPHLMSAFAGPFFAAAGLLGAAGLLKIVRPAAAAHALRGAGLPGSRTVGRLLGVAETAIAVAALVVGGRVTALLVAACYLGFAAFLLRLRRHAGRNADCGCFGASDAPATGVHVAVNLVLAGVALLCVVWPTDGLGQVMADTPLAGIPFLGFTVVCGWLLYVILTVVPDLQAAASGSRSHRAIGHGR